MAMEVEFEKYYEAAGSEERSEQVSDGLNRLFQRDGSESEYRIPTELGQGFCRRIRPAAAIDITVCDLCFYEDLRIQERAVGRAYHLTFCLADQYEFQLQGERGSYGLETGESCVYAGGCVGVSDFQSGRRYGFVIVNLEPERFEAAFECFNRAGAISDMGNLAATYRKFAVTPAVGRILGQLARGSQGDSVSNLYLEGKTLELVNAYWNEMASRSRGGAEGSRVRLSGQDHASLRLAKEILDREFAAPPTLAGLAKLICLNEFKLKQGFKEVFGQPVYAYVVERRMEAAQRLLGEERSVKEVAGLVGYTNISHFGAAFRKKFGINPGAYLRR